MKGAAFDGTPDAAEVEAVAQQLAQRRIVQQRSRRAAREPAQRQRRQPARAGDADTRRIGAINLMRIEVFPDAHQAGHPGPEILRRHGQRCGVKGAGRGAAKNRERIALRLVQQLANRLQHTDLIAGTRAAAGQDQGGARFAHGKVNCRSWPAAAPRPRARR